jgi:PAS domain S-box-containing protein
MNEMQLVNLESEFNQRIKTDVSIFNFICNDVLDGIWYWDLENPEHEWMSRNYWTTLGFNPDEMPHNSDAWQEIIHPDDLVLAREVLQKHFENPSIPYDQTVRMFRKDGEMIWIRCKAQALANEDGKLIRMIGAHFITSTLVFKEDEVVKQLDLGNESIYIALHNDENGTPSAQAIQEILQPNKIESNYLAKNSKLSEKLSSFFSSTTFNKQQIGSFVQNLANQVELQNQIKSRDLLLNYFNQNTKDGLLIFNEKLKAIYINEAVNDLAGKKFNQFPISLSQTINYFHPEDLQELIIIITEAIDQKKEKLKTQHRAFSSKQKIVWIESNITFTYNSTGDFQMAFVISRDITKTIQLAKELKQISERRKNIAELLIEEREKNKEELYTELHDGINQLLFAARLNIENSGLKDENLEKSVFKLKSAIEHIRKIALESTTQFVFGDYFVSSLTDYILGFNNTVIKFRVETDIQEPFIINDQSKKHIFRIVQQLVQFSLEMSKATRIVFRFKQIDSDFVIVAIDNGIFNCNTPLENLNLKSIKDRIYLLDGKMRFFNLDQKGLIVYIKLRINE